MQTFGAFLVSFLAASGMAAALPTEGQKTASVEVTYNQNYAAHGPTQLYKAKRKYGAPISDNLKAIVANRKALIKRQTGSAPNHPSDSADDEYITNVSIGTPAQVLPLDFDTGSSDLWVFSSETPKSSASGHTIYTPSKSSTSKKLSGATWSIEYGDKSTSSGDVYTDKVTVGGFSVSTQAVESATKVSAQFVQDTANSGLLGLAFDSINTVSPRQQKTWFSNAANSLAQPLFTANLNHQATGSYNFGFIDTSLASGPINYVPVDNSQGFWGFTASGYSVGGGKLNRSSLSGIADTGTTLLLLPDAVVNAYYANVESAEYDDEQEGVVFDCSEDLPTFSFGVGSGTITIPGDLLNLTPIDSSGQTCYGGLQSSSDIGINIFGDVALKAALVVFDLGNERLGWAQK
ncbi:secreted aspartic ase precursor [Trichoderma arundinaceum]|uniref:Secreted aspartic ase n=1 Tax=Trichoderma arundinaceum TaxID=490622 RepID=A0A395NB42_TRIAR|nr:secreted aspartic ase precursor [Trichoderma arundinaceum]